MKRKKFTLVELLVVVAVIGILASLLFPTLSKARKKALNVLCVNNLKQINIASTMFSDDNDDRYPNATSTSEEYTRRGRTRTRATGYSSWDDKLAGYDGRTTLSLEQQYEFFLPEDYQENVQIYSCPSSPALLPNFPSFFMRSYAINQWNGDDTDNKRKGVSQANGKTRKTAQISSPSSSIAYMEKKWCMMGRKDDYFYAELMWKKLFWEDGDLDYDGAEFHDTTSNYSMADASVKGMRFWNTFRIIGGGFGTYNDVEDTYWDAGK